MGISVRDQHFGRYEQLLSAKAVRQRCHLIGDLAMNGNAHWFKFNQTHFPRCVDLVADSCKRNYPKLKIPLHSRWRHLSVGGIDLWQYYTQDYKGNPIGLAKSAVDLIFVSVLLDAGAGSQWVYEEPVTKKRLSRSEGLAAASADLFFNHLANFDKDNGWWITPESLRALNASSLSKVFQHDKNNHLIGIEGRVALLHGLANILENEANRGDGLIHPGAIVDYFFTKSKPRIFSRRQVDITDVLTLILKKFSKMWPSGLTQEGLNLGDCGLHSGIKTDDKTTGIIPFHKLSQWLTYSLVEPLKWAGFYVVNLEGMTGLPEYRNGGLFIDTGVLQPFDSQLLKSRLKLNSEAIVEWRALTVFILDQLAVDLRKKLKLNEKELPMGAVLQGGTWMVGRELAAKLRSDSAPPLNLDIDGTVF